MLDILRQMIHGRRHPRVLADPEFPIHLHINALGSQFDVNAYDIAEGGLGFLLPENVSKRIINSPMSLTVTLPKEEPFIVLAKIRHLTGEVYGIEYFELERVHRKKIRRYVNRVAKYNPTLLTKGYQTDDGMRKHAT